jgi:hypothetical protein
MVRRQGDLMSNPKLTAARAIKSDLIPTEASIDAALGQLGQLISTACRARLDGGLPAHLGQEAMGHLTAATAMMGEIRGRVLSAHQCFALDGRKILPALALGDSTECPAQASLDDADHLQPLRAVA